MPWIQELTHSPDLSLLSLSSLQFVYLFLPLNTKSNREVYWISEEALEKEGKK